MGDFPDDFRRLDDATRVHLGPYTEHFQAALKRLAEAQAVRRLWARDGSLWRDDINSIREIERRLGWLDLPRSMPVEVTRLRALAQEVRAAGLERVVVLGMGGSSLAAEVLAESLGMKAEGLELVVLDSTDPGQIRRVAAAAPLADTLFVLASKSGTTAEPLALYDYFRGELSARQNVARWSRHFMAITDAGTSLEKLAAEANFRACYLNPADVGGRYSALSLFGLVPATLLGIDLDKLLGRGHAMAWACRDGVEPQDNPGLTLGAIMGGLWQAEPGRDKLTVVTSPELAPMGVWIEQLIAESTGKGGKGLVPLVGEEPALWDTAKDQRLYVYLRLEGSANEEIDAYMRALADDGQPVVVLVLSDLYDLGAEFFRWEYATAILGYLMGLNPFDQPDVDGAKQRAHEALQRYEQSGDLGDQEPLAENAEVALYGPEIEGAFGVQACLRAFLEQVRQGDYVALLAYLDRNEVHAARLAELQRWVSQEVGIPASVGFGPRFLHSTGQLHKGGPDSGLFLQITYESEALPIPGRAYGFDVLQLAQAQGDLRALHEKGRRAMRVHLRQAPEQGLRSLIALLHSSA
ncbi:MAG: glucose-6-phosphate isomerase [Anaerolineae bacterium]|nr:glucose-6-phosphate isomerase [Anaerolineae bacterium]